MPDSPIPERNQRSSGGSSTLQTCELHMDLGRRDQRVGITNLGARGSAGLSCEDLGHDECVVDGWRDGVPVHECGHAGTVVTEDVGDAFERDTAGRQE